MNRILSLLSILFFLSCSHSKGSENTAKQEIVHDSSIVRGKIDSLSELSQQTNDVKNQTNDAGKDWLESLFKCRNGNNYCFYLDQEEQVCTERFYQFMIDSEQIYGATSLLEEEIPAAENIYREKWGKIYPLRKDMEPWLFGRGQDDMEHIRSVKVEKTDDLKYLVFVDYDEDYKTLSEVRLLPDQNSFLIDYCDTKFLK